jgi:hypothetical protein
LKVGAEEPSKLRHGGPFEQRDLVGNRHELSRNLFAKLRVIASNSSGGHQSLETRGNLVVVDEISFVLVTSRRERLR